MSADLSIRLQLVTLVCYSIKHETMYGEKLEIQCSNLTLALLSDLEREETR